MSILNRNPNDGLHSILLMLYQCVLSEGRMPKEKLLALCDPTTIWGDDVESKRLAKKTLNRWIQLGLFEEQGDSITISTSLGRECRDKKTGVLELPRTIRRIVLEQSNNERFWEADDNRSADFTRALSWMLAQNAYYTEFSSFEDAQEREIQQFNDESIRVFTSNVRWSGFKAWASFLGFGWIAKFPKNDTFVIDPTVAVREALGAVFGDCRELDHKSFFTRLAVELPVVDGGQYRLDVEGRIDAKNWQSPGPNFVSTSLSRSLERLRVSGVLTLESRADAEKRTLTGQEQISPRTISHLLWKGMPS